MMEQMGGQQKQAPKKKSAPVPPTLVNKENPSEAPKSEAIMGRPTSPFDGAAEEMTSMMQEGQGGEEPAGPVITIDGQEVPAEGALEALLSLPGMMEKAQAIMSGNQEQGEY